MEIGKKVEKESLNIRLGEIVEQYGYNAVLQALAEMREISPQEILSSREDLEKPKQDGHKGDAIEEKFVELASEWSEAVGGISSTVEMAKHPAYQEIISMGEAVIPYLLEDLRENPLYWLAALREITQENPVLPEQRGKVKQMASAWLNWGKEKGYIA